MEIIGENTAAPVAAPAARQRRTELASSLNIGDMMFLLAHNWYWFVLSLAVALTLAFVYIAKTTPTYQRTVSLMLRDESKGNMQTNVDLSDMGIMQQSTNMDNEILSFRSLDLMTEVIESLGLNNSYTVSDGLRRRELYRESPVLVNPADSTMPDVYGFDIEMHPDSTFTLSKFRIGGEEADGAVDGRVGEMLETPVGRLALEPSPWKSAFDDAEIRYAHYPAEALAPGLVGQLSVVEATGKGSVLDISAVATSVRKADDILLTLIRIYNDRWLKDRNQIAVATSQFINERLAVIESELGNVDSDISSYKATHLIPDVSAASSMYFSQSAENQQQISELMTQLSIAQMVKNELASSALDKTLPSNLGLDNGSIASQIGEYNQTVLNRNRILAGSSERNPVVQDLTQTLQQLKSNIFESVDNYVSSLNTRLSSIRRQEAQTTGKLAANPGQAKYLLSVERQQKVKESLYLFLLQKREENELSQAFTAYNSKIINKPNGSMSPIAPVRTQIVMIAFALGLLLPAGILIMRMMLNNKLRGRKDLEGLDIPFVAEIPEVAALKPRKGVVRKTGDSIVVRHGSRDMVNEAFRVARTNLSLLMGSKAEHNVFVFTSFNPGSGKSFVSVNIACAYALKKKRVLIIDGDLRKASLSRYVGSPSKGLVDYLSGTTDAVATLVRDMPGMDGNLQILPVGAVPPNPTELLENGRLQPLIESLRADYDYVFIDCAPIDIVADTQIIAPMADRVVFIVRAGLLDRSMISTLQDIYDERRFPGLCLVLNGSQTSGPKSYGYRYGYHYGYGKSSDYYVSK